MKYNIPCQRWFLLLLASVTWSIITLAQTYKSSNGFGKSPHGTIRVFLIFAEVDWSSCSGGSPYSAPSASSLWQPGQLPSDAGNYFDPVIPSGGPSGYISKYFHEMSMGDYIVLGDYYPSLISIPCTSRTAFGASEVIQKIVDIHNASGLPVKTQNNYLLDDFDSWALPGTPGLAKSNSVNSKIDVLAIIWRDNDNLDGNLTCGGGYGLSGAGFGVGNMQLGNKAGFDMATIFTACGSGEGGYGMVTKEYFHGLFGGNNFHTAGGASQHTFLATPRTYSD